MGNFDTAWQDSPSTSTPISSTYLTAVDAAIRTARSDRVPDALVTKLDQSSASAVVVVLGDSTGVPGSTGDWVADWAVLLGARWLTHKVTTRLWGGSSYGSASTVANGSASLTLDVYNGSVGGTTSTYPLTRIAGMLPVAPDLVILNYGHNNAGDSVASFQSGIDSLVSSIRGTWANAPIVVTSQNPRFSPAGNIAEHAAREQAKRAWTASREYGYVPAWEAFQAQANPAAFVQSDGIHPTITGATNDGSALWAAAVHAYIAGRSRRPVAAAASTSSSTAGRDLRWFVPSGATSLDEFNDDTLDAAWLRVDGTGAVSGNATWTEKGDVLSAYNAGADSSGVLHALIRPIGAAMAVGDAFVTSLRLMGINLTLGGIVLTDSTAFGSGGQVVATAWSDDAVSSVRNYAPFTGNNWSGLASSGTAPKAPGMEFIRIVLAAANTWRVDVSPDGVSWVLGQTATKTLTPTHVGLVSSSWGSATKQVVSYEFLRRVSGVS